MLVSLGLTFHKQLKLYGDGASVLSLVLKTREVRQDNSRLLVYKASYSTTKPQRFL